jgi:hypothetical protein
MANLPNLRDEQDYSLDVFCAGPAGNARKVHSLVMYAAYDAGLGRADEVIG